MKQDKIYTNPFQQRATNWLNIDIKRFKKLKENKFNKMKDIRKEKPKKCENCNFSNSKKFHTADQK